MQVYFTRETKLPILDLRLAFHAGSARDGQNYGLAAITSSMIDQGCGELTSQQIAIKLAALGARLSAGVDQDKGLISFRTLTNSPIKSQALNLFLNIIKSPSFSTAPLNIKKAQTLTALKDELQDPSSIASNAFF